jgi:hypothetical protein
MAANILVVDDEQSIADLIEVYNMIRTGINKQLKCAYRCML